MSYFDISGATFDENLRKLETTDPAHADVFNALLGQLINNDVALKEAVTKFAASKNEQALFLLNLHKDGKKYGVHFDNYDVTPSSNGTRLFDAVGMTAAPSTNTTSWTWATLAAFLGFWTPASAMIPTPWPSSP